MRNDVAVEDYVEGYEDDDDGSGGEGEASKREREGG